MTIQLYYEIPIFAIILLLIYFVAVNFKTWNVMAQEEFKKIFFWLMMSGLSILIWGVDHLYHDLVPVSPEMALFMHYVVSHGFLLIAVVFLAIAGHNIARFGEKFGYK